MKTWQKALITVSVFLVLVTGVGQLIKFYIGHVPVAQPGECLHLSFEYKEAIVEVVLNNVKRGESMLFSHSNKTYVAWDFYEIRQLNPRKVECPPRSLGTSTEYVN